MKWRKHSLLSKIWAFEHSSLESNLGLTLHSLVPNEAYWLSMHIPDGGWETGGTSGFLKHSHLVILDHFFFSHYWQLTLRQQKVFCQGLVRFLWCIIKNFTSFTLFSFILDTIFSSIWFGGQGLLEWRWPDCRQTQILVREKS